MIKVTRERTEENNNMETSVITQYDLVLADILEQLGRTINEEDEDSKELFLQNTYEYVRGLQDGLRFGRPRPKMIKIID